METKEFIHKKMISYFENASSNRFGKLKIIDLNLIFEDRMEEVLNYIEKDPILTIDNFGWTKGNCLILEGMHQIKDQELKSKCNQAWINNQNRINSINLY